MILSTLMTALVLSNVSLPPEGTATIPIKDLLELQRNPAAARPSPPVDGLVTRTQLKGRLSEEAMHVEAHFEVHVLASGSWTRLELLELGPDAWLVEANSSPEGASLAVVDGRLVLLSNLEGHYRFTVRVNVRASGSRADRRAMLKLGRHVAPVPLQLEVDGAVFSVADREILPKERAIGVLWRQVAPVTEKVQVVRPPLEPRVSTATASWVTTLEGNLTLRAQYTARLDRKQTLAFELPAHHTLDRATVNGIPVVAKADASRVELELAPERLGDSEATVELVLSRKLGTFHLSGRIDLELPRVSWPVDSLLVRAHLPAVFNYQRIGGSLELSDGGGAVEQTHLPGKELQFRQMLVGATAPSLELAYSVDISRSYFR